MLADNNHQHHQPSTLSSSTLANRERDIAEYANQINYSKRYTDDTYEYRHVILPKQLTKYLPSPPRLMTEAEWRSLGVQQSPGWEHYMIHQPEPHILLFKRPKELGEKYPPVN